MCRKDSSQRQKMRKTSRLTPTERSDKGGKIKTIIRICRWNNKTIFAFLSLNAHFDPLIGTKKRRKYLFQKQNKWLAAVIRISPPDLHVFCYSAAERLQIPPAETRHQDWAKQNRKTHSSLQKPSGVRACRQTHGWPRFPWMTCRNVSRSECSERIRRQNQNRPAVLQ